MKKVSLKRQNLQQKMSQNYLKTLNHKRFHNHQKFQMNVVNKINKLRSKFQGKLLINKKQVKK